MPVKKKGKLGLEKLDDDKKTVKQKKENQPKAEKKPVEKARPKQAQKPQHELMAAIRIRGPVNINRHVEYTLKMLNLERVNHCIVIPRTPDYEGMLRMAGECITWGEISRQTLETLLSKRGFIGGKNTGCKKVDKQDSPRLAEKVAASGIKAAGIKPVFRLKPPSKGLKSIRHFFPAGDLGYRGKAINELLKRMM